MGTGAMKMQMVNGASHNANGKTIKSAMRSDNAYFGVSLNTLLQREGTMVPKLVTQICDYLYVNGLRHEGLFRLSGSSKAMEMLRNSFDNRGTADFESLGDVVSTACLLKQFLRELPERLINESVTNKLAAEHEGWLIDNVQSVANVKKHLKDLPSSSYATLKYLMSFLAILSQSQTDNKMNSRALGIVFGPNIFSCFEGVQGLQQQAIVNELTSKFIERYDDFFLEKDEVSPYKTAYRFPKDVFRKIAPPRPPPPAIDLKRSESSGNSPRPVPSPRKSKLRKLQEQQETLRSKGRESTSDNSELMVETTDSSVRMSDDEFIGDITRSVSPSHFDSDKSDIFPQSPRVTLTTNPLVISAISSVVSERLFGSESSTDDDRPNGSIVTTTGTLPKKNTVKQESRTSKPKSDEILADRHSSEERMDTADHSELSVKEKKKLFETSLFMGDYNSLSADNKNKHQANKNRHSLPGSQPSPSSQDTSELHSATVDTVSSSHNDLYSLSLYEKKSELQPAPRLPRKSAPSTTYQDNSRKIGDVEEHNKQSNVEPLDAFDSIVQHTSSSLPSFKRVSGPGNRRMPSKSGKAAIEIEHSPRDKDILQSTFDSWLENGLKQVTTSDNNQNVTKQPSSTVSSSKSKTLKRNDEELVDSKSMVPPLDFSQFTDTGEKQGTLKKSGKKTTTPTEEVVVITNGGSAKVSPKASDRMVEGSNSAKMTELSTASIKAKKTTVAIQKMLNDLPLENGNSLDKKVGGARERRAVAKEADKLKEIEVDVEEMVENVPSKTLRRSNQPAATITGDQQGMQIKQLTRKIQALKQKIRDFEDSFEDEYARKPSQAEKADVAEIKASMVDLAQARKELRRLRQLDDQNQEDQLSPTVQLTTAWGENNLTALKVSQLTNAPEKGKTLEKRKLASEQHSAGVREAVPEKKSTSIVETRNEMDKKLEEWRIAAGRPYHLAMMTMEQMHEEKVCIQKILLEYESVHGRPTTKSMKETMRPIYDRYRSVKKYLANPPSIRMPSLPLEEAGDEDRHSDYHSSQGAPTPLDTAFNKQSSPSLDDNVRDLPGLDDNVQDLSLKHLINKHRRLVEEKKKLGVVLNAYEKEFQRKYGRKVEKDDRQPMASEYQQYKKLKAEIKYVETLISNSQS